MSAAFGNISRGACPVMMLSRNLPLTTGFKNAVALAQKSTDHAAERWTKEVTMELNTQADEDDKRQEDTKNS